MRLRAFLLTSVLLAALTALPATAATLRYAAAGDLVTLDPHSFPDSFTDGMLHNLYERLLTRDRNYQLAPSLALSWTPLSPTRMRLVLRRGVVFHDGSPFTAEDVVFSFARMHRPSSNARNTVAGIREAVKVDDYTVDVITDRPLPTLLQQLAVCAMVSKTWAVKNGVEEPHNYAAGKESFSARHANGTGPYMIQSFEPGVKLVLVSNPRWWGLRDGQATGNVTEAVFRPLRSNATRVAALLSGEVDALIDPPPQDLDRLAGETNLKVMKGLEFRVLYLSFDVSRDELLFSSVKGKNPFKDRRVREAVALSIDTEAIHQKIMRGLSSPTGTVVPKGATGYSEKAAKRTLPDPARAKALLTEAGYPQGFAVTLDCSNDRYILDEQICVAIAGMMSRTGIQTAANLRPKAVFFQKIDVSNRETSLCLLGLGAITADAMIVVDSLLHSHNAPGRGENNTGGLASPKMDALLDSALVELDPAKRNAALEEVQLLMSQEFWAIPIHQQMTPWALRKNIAAIYRPDNFLDLRWVTVN